MTVLNDTRNLEKRSFRQINPKVDKATLGAVSITHREFGIHDGHNFRVSKTFQNVDTGASAVRGLVFYLPDTVTDTVHLKFQVSTTAFAKVELFEDADVATSGVAFPAFDSTPINSRRLSANTSELKVGIVDSGEDAGVSGGTLLDESLAGGPSAPSAGPDSGSVSLNGEFILKRNSVATPPATQSAYYLKITDLEDDNNFTVGISWLEDEEFY